MKSVRLAWLASLVVAGVLLSGCQGPMKIISRSEFDRLRQAERLNQEQSAYITGLINEKERLSMTVDSLEGKVGLLEVQRDDKAILVELQLKDLQQLQAELDKARTSKPALAGDWEVFPHPEGVGIRVGSDVLFDAGQATLRPGGEKVLSEIAQLVKDRPNDLRISGYTDSEPITVSGWKSNFELSGARALTVLEFLNSAGIDPARMHFAGHGEYALIPNPDGTENMEKSRRAEILLLTEGAGAPAGGGATLR